MVSRAPRKAGTPFYCDPERIGAFAVAPDELAAGTDAAVFRLFVTLSMYQALRDVVITRQQRSLPRASMRVVADVAFLKRSISQHQCPTLSSVEAFEESCDVTKTRERVDWGQCPGVACHVKDATVVFNRMGDMGKLPLSTRSPCSPSAEGCGNVGRNATAPEIALRGRCKKCKVARMAREWRLEALP